MIGMAGDDKNKGSLIVNMNKQPAEEGQPHNPNAGLVHAAKNIISAIQSNDSDTLAHNLKSFVNMCTMQAKQNKLEEELKQGQSGVNKDLESRNRIGKGY